MAGHSLEEDPNFSFLIEKAGGKKSLIELSANKGTISFHVLGEREGGNEKLELNYDPKSEANYYLG